LFQMTASLDITKDIRMTRRAYIRCQDRDGDVLDAPVVKVQESIPELEEPSMYKVVMLNDDYTPMEFVVEVLQMFFSMDREKAQQIMLAVHTLGRATCGIFTRDVADTKSEQVNQYAQMSQYPLLSIVERA